MTCHHCETKSEVYDLKKICCFARFVDKTANELCAKYGHDMAALTAESAALRTEAKRRAKA